MCRQWAYELFLCLVFLFLGALVHSILFVIKHILESILLYTIYWCSYIMFFRSINHIRLSFQTKIKWTQSYPGVARLVFTFNHMNLIMLSSNVCLLYKEINIYNFCFIAKLFIIKLSIFAFHFLFCVQLMYTLSVFQIKKHDKNHELKIILYLNLMYYLLLIKLQISI